MAAASEGNLAKPGVSTKRNLSPKATETSNVPQHYVLEPRLNTPEAEYATATAATTTATTT